MPQTIKLRAKDAMRRELANAALDVVMKHGFDTITADEIAAAIGMSRATFFRQFGSKEGAVVAAFIGTSMQFADAYRHATGRTVWDRLRAAIEPAVTFSEADPARSRRRLAFIGDHPGLFARLKHERAPQIDALAQALQEGGAGPLQARVLANAAVSTLDQSFQHWKEQEARSIRDVVDEGFAHLIAAAAHS
ncbi:MAG: TetR family transcriptional regulator [Pseudomonadota bacterium]|nr:TetR family transcriptional regulator [Pseudomonadota bacterium]